MFEGCAGPANRSVATIATHGRWNVRARLALRSALIVALGARSWSHAIVRKKRWGPTRGSMTAVAVNRGRQVVRRFKG